MFGWMKKRDSGKLVTDELEAKKARLEELRQRQAQLTTRFNAQTDEYMKVHELRTRISRIIRRNKPRTILVVPFINTDDSMLLEVLLEANSNAVPTFSTGVEDATELLQKNDYDMIYVVVDMEAEGHGPCFFSASHEQDAEEREEHCKFLSYVEKIEPYVDDAEIVVVCGSSKQRCPIADKVITQRFRRELLNEAGSQS